MVVRGLLFGVSEVPSRDPASGGGVGEYVRILYDNTCNALVTDVPVHPFYLYTNLRKCSHCDSNYESTWGWRKQKALRWAPVYQTVDAKRLKQLLTDIIPRLGKRLGPKGSVLVQWSSRSELVFDILQVSIAYSPSLTYEMVVNPQAPPLFPKRMPAAAP